MSDTLNAKPAGADLSRLSVSVDGRLYWDGKPVVIRRRLVLSFWQKLATMLIGLAAVMIALSVVVHATISAHDWLCVGKWLTSNCPVPPLASATNASPAPVPHAELPN